MDHLSQQNTRDQAIMRAQEHHHGLPLLPRPTSDPRDPLRWPRWQKLLVLLATSLFNFTANFAGAGLSVAIPVLQVQYRKTENEVNALLTVSAPCQIVSTSS